MKDGGEFLHFHFYFILFKAQPAKHTLQRLKENEKPKPSQNLNTTTE